MTDYIKIKFLKIKLSIDIFLNQVNKFFEIRKLYQYKQYYFPLLRNKYKIQISSFYYQIKANQSSLNNLSKEKSEGYERLKLDLIEPFNLINLNPENPEITKLSKDSIINEPIKKYNQWYLILREKLLPAIYNEYYENQIFSVLLEKEYFNLMNKEN